MNDILVSVICTTYNHGKYIKDALDGFVNQKTEFAYEVLIHDDASTDNTVAVIRQYELEYPEIIIPVYEHENQYSKNVRIIYDIMLPKSKGKYIAFCEGDDYWICCDKLQIQVDFMEQHPECSMSCHAYNSIIADNKEIIETKHALNEGGLLSVEDSISCRAFCQLATFLIKKECLIMQPKQFTCGSFGDYPLRIWAGLQGKVYYLDYVMSNYRVMSTGSWSERQSKNKSFQRQIMIERKIFLEFLNEYTNGKYQDVISDKIKKEELSYYMCNENYIQIKRDKLYEIATGRERIRIFLGLYFPALLQVIYSIKNNK